MRAVRGVGSDTCSCFRIPKMSSGHTHRPIFCVECTIAIIEQTKIELSAVEEEVRGKGSKY